MREKLPTIARVLLGLLFFVLGIAGLFNLMPPPPDIPERLTNFNNALIATGYFIPFLKITETVCGFLLLFGIIPSLALIVLAPISVNIVLVHLFLTPGLQNLIVPIVIVALHLTAASKYRSVYRPLFSSKAV